MSGGHAPKLGPVFAFTRDRLRTAEFYRELAGLPPRDGDEAWLAAENAEVVIRASGDDGDTPPEVRASPGFVVWIGVPDLDAVHRKATVAGVTVGPHYGDYFFARDPDGRYVGFYPLEENAAEHGHHH